jgi:rubrerythrin
MTDEQQDVPGERRLTCSHCGWDGGTYSFTTTADPSYCPGCGRPTSAADVDVIEPEGEPTALTWSGE